MRETIIVKVNSAYPEKEKIQQAVEVIKNGGLVIFPTDTVYGIGANAFLSEAVKKIYQVKGRTFKKPLILLLENQGQVYPLVSEISEEAKKIIKKYWPGPLSLIFKASPLGTILTGGLKTIALRIPDNKIALSMIKTAGVPLATTSANLAGKKSPIRARETVKDFKNKVDLIVDAGVTKYQVESTILDLSVYPYQIIREGYIKKYEILNTKQ